jgi:hypothetical protein
MNRSTVLPLILLLCASSPDSAAGGTRQPNQEPIETATVALTAFDANETTLRLRCKIANRSDRDIWVCDGLYSSTKVFTTDYEVYMDDDARTVVIRRQIEVPTTAELPLNRFRARYIVVHPGQERGVCLSLPVPVIRRPLLASRGPDADYATRIVLKVGFYNGDLPGKIRRLLDLAGRLSSVQPQVSYADSDLYFRYFAGFSISQAFGGLGGFADFWTEGSEQIGIPYMWLPLGDESCLQVAVDGVLIPMGK